MKLFKILMVMGVLAFGTTANASVVPVDNLLTIDFGGVYGGTLDGVPGANASGANINISTLTIQDDTGTTVYDVQGGLLNFNTANNSVRIDGAVSDLGITDTILFSGAFFNWEFIDGLTDVFVGDGTGYVGQPVMDNVVSDDVNPFSFVGFSLESYNGDVLSTDYLMTATETRTPEVPVPAAVWLFGSGLLGLVGVARRKTMA